MRNLAFVPFVLFCIGAAPAQGPSAFASPDAAATAAPSKAPRAETRPGEILLTPPAHCLDAEPRRTDGQTLGPQRLDQLPQGNLSLAVVRQVNGCPQSTAVREGYGAPAFRTEPGR
jgi:hypothetical protein